MIQRIDPSRAMSTDVSLLGTRTVASEDDREPRADDGARGVPQERDESRRLAQS